MPQHLKVLIAGISSLVLTLGVARFAYTPMLHVMQEQTALNDVIGGWLASFNYMGYLSGTLIAMFVNDLVFKDRLYRIGLTLAVITTFMMAITENWIIWSLSRYLAGLSSAAGLLLGSGLILNWLIRYGHKMELGIHFAGLGIGIALTAVVVETMYQFLNWSMQWHLFAVIGLSLMWPAWRWLPKPEGHNVTRTGKELVDKPPSKNWLTLLTASYFCAGVGYVINATFIVVIADNQPALAGYGNWAWLIVGVIGAPSCITWDRIARNIGELKALMIAYAIQMISILLLSVDSSITILFISAAMYGATVFGIVSLMLTMAGKLYPTKPAKLMGKISLFYAIAQIVAPAIAGIVAEATESYNSSLYAATVTVFLGLLMLIKLTRIPMIQTER